MCSSYQWARLKKQTKTPQKNYHSGTEQSFNHHWFVWQVEREAADRDKQYLHLRGT